MNEQVIEKSPQYLAVERGVAIIGTWAKAAALLGYKSAWGLQKMAPELPDKKVIPFCALTDWQVYPNQVRPDIYPYPQDGLPPERRVLGQGA